MRSHYMRCLFVAILCALVAHGLSTASTSVYGVGPVVLAGKYTCSGADLPTLQSGAGYTWIDFNDKEWGNLPAAAHSNTTNKSRLYPLSAGLVDVDAWIHWPANGTNSRSVTIGKNHAVAQEFLVAAVAGGRMTIQHVHAQLSVTATDYIEIGACHDAGGPLTVAYASVIISYRGGL